MNIHEYQAKRMLSRNGIKIPKGRIAYTVVAVPRSVKDEPNKGPRMLKPHIPYCARAAGRFLSPTYAQRRGLRQLTVDPTLWRGR